MTISLDDIENAIHDAKNREIALYNAALDLAAKLRVIERNPAFKGVWGFLHAHNYHYDGPNWEPELKALEQQLAPASTGDTEP